MSERQRGRILSSAHGRQGLKLRATSWRETETPRVNLAMEVFASPRLEDLAAASEPAPTAAEEERTSASGIEVKYKDKEQEVAKVVAALVAARTVDELRAALLTAIPLGGTPAVAVKIRDARERLAALKEASQAPEKAVKKPSHGRRDDIDGLRTLAVAAVIAFHTDASGFQADSSVSTSSSSLAATLSRPCCGRRRNRALVFYWTSIHAASAA